MVDDWTWRGRSIRQQTSGFDNFKEVVEGYRKLDVSTKNAVLKASSTVVSIISRIGDKMLFIGSGTIIECDEEHGSFLATILTSGTLLQGTSGAAFLPSNLKIDVYLSDGKLYEGQVFAYDFHYNIATIKIKSNTPFSTATIRYIDDSIAIDMSKPVLVRNRSPARYKLCPGECVIALGRDCVDSHEIMASPGVFSVRDCFHDCKELFHTSCVVTKVAVGGPVVNLYGEVIGVNFFLCPYGAFLPINIVSKCLEDLKKNRQVARPWFGASFANLYSADLDKLDKLYQKFPHIAKGVIVEQVTENRSINYRKRRAKIHHWTFWSARKWLKAKNMLEKIRKKERTKLLRRVKKTKSSMRRMQVEEKSPRSLGGLCVGDVIIKCGEISVSSHLEVVEALWDKEGKSVELLVIRPSIGQQRKLSVAVGRCPKMNLWKLSQNGSLPQLEEELAQERSTLLTIKVDNME